MNTYTERDFEDMTESFQIAFGFANARNYEQSIPLYIKAIEEDKNNFAAFNNIAVAEIFIGIKKKDLKLIEDAINHLQEAIRITKEVYKYEDGYPIAEGNLNWAKEELLKIRG